MGEVTEVGSDQSNVVTVSVVLDRDSGREVVTFSPDDGWLVDMSATVVVAKRYDLDVEDIDDVDPVEVRTWPLAFGGVGVVEIHTAPQ